MPSAARASVTFARAAARSLFFSRDFFIREVIVGSPKESHQLANLSGVSASDVSDDTAATGYVRASSVHALSASFLSAEAKAASVFCAAQAAEEAKAASAAAAAHPRRIFIVFIVPPSLSCP